MTGANGSFMGFAKHLCVSLFFLFLFLMNESTGFGQGRQKLLPDISLIGSVAGAYFQNEPVGDQGENPSRTGLNLQGLELALQSVVDPYVRGDVFILFKEDSVEVEDATLTTLSLPGNFQMRAGKMLVRFGRQNTQHTEQLNFVDQSRNNRFFFGPEGFSELGGEASVLFPTPWFSELSFEFLQGENAGNFDGSRKEDFAYLGHWKNAVDLTPDLTFQNGLSGIFGFNNTAAGNSTQIYGTDIYFRWKPSLEKGLKWQTEYFIRRLEGLTAIQVEGGAYSELLYQFARRWETGLRYERVGLPDEGFRENSGSAVLTFLPTEFFRVRSQYNLIRPDGGGYQHEAFLQLQFNIGPHGAHVF